MKAAANGVLNLSTLDGWWAEAWEESGKRDQFIGWAIGRGEIHEDRNYQDQIEAEALYELLEHDVVPSFYERGKEELPVAWIKRMKSAVAGLCYTYNTHRMVREYTERFYLMAHAKRAALVSEDAAHAKGLAVWRERIHGHWPEIRIEEVTSGTPKEIQVGSEVVVTAKVHLGELSPEEVIVELYWGKLDAGGDLADALAIRMSHAGVEGTLHRFEAKHGPCQRSGLLGYTVRILPYHVDLTSPFPAGLHHLGIGVGRRRAGAESGTGSRRFDGNAAAVPRQPVLESLERWIQSARLPEVPRAAEVLFKIPLELEHVRQVIRARETEAREHLRRDRIVDNLFTDRLAQCGGHLRTGEVLAGDADRLAHVGHGPF